MRLLVPALLFAFAAAPASGEEASEQIPTLSVTGQGQASAEPDVATVRLGATAQAPEAAEAQQQVNQLMNRTIAAVRDLDIPEKQITTVTIPGSWLTVPATRCRSRSMI